MLGAGFITYGLLRFGTCLGLQFARAFSMGRGAQTSSSLGVFISTLASSGLQNSPGDQEVGNGFPRASSSALV